MLDELQLIRAENVVIKEGQNQPSVFANLCGVTFTAEEVILQFAQRNPGTPLEATGVVRVTTTMPHIKRLAGVLMSSILRHEEAFGTIEVDVVARLSPEVREHIKFYESENEPANK